MKVPRIHGGGVGGSATVFGLLRGSAIGSTPAFGAGYPGSSPGPGANFSCMFPHDIAEVFAQDHSVGTDEASGEGTTSQPHRDNQDRAAELQLVAASGRYARAVCEVGSLHAHIGRVES